MSSKEVLAILSIMGGLFAIGGVLAWGVLILGAQPRSGGPATSDHALAGDNPIPDVAWEGLAGTPDTRSTALIDGTPKVINVWASWCPTCTAEMADLQAFHNASGGQVDLIGVNIEEPPRDAEAFIRQRGLTFLMYHDVNSTFPRQAGARALPTTFLVDENGQIVYTHVGGLTAQSLARLCREHLGVYISI